MTTVAMAILRLIPTGDCSGFLTSSVPLFNLYVVTRYSYPIATSIAHSFVTLKAVFKRKPIK